MQVDNNIYDINGSSVTDFRDTCIKDTQNSSWANVFETDIKKESQSVVILIDTSTNDSSVALLTSDSSLKYCKCCKLEKQITLFGIDVSQKDGKTKLCKECRNKNDKIYRQQNIKRFIEYRRQKGYWKRTEEEKSKNKMIRREKYFAEFVKYVTENGGICLGTINDYKGARIPIKIKCNVGHEFKLSLNNSQKKRWCPKCKINIGEIIALNACNYLFGKKFEKVRPQWLKNDENNNLELDIYNEELKLAVEYNGIQHYKYIPYFHRSIEEFEKRKTHDLIKIEKCKEKGVCLIIIPYTVHNDDICSYIYETAVHHKLQVVNHPSGFECGNLKCIYEFTEEIKKLIEQKEGKLLNGRCMSKHSSIVVQCKENHVWNTRVRYIKEGKWCKECKLHLTQKTQKTQSSKSTKNVCLSNVLLEKEKTITKNDESSQTVNLNNEFKICNTCKQNKLKKDFNNKTAAADGMQPNCKQCVKEIKGSWRKNLKLVDQSFDCDQCDKTYKLKDSLTRHKKEKHFI